MVSIKRKLKFAFIDVFVIFLLLTGAFVYLLLPKGTSCHAEYTLLFTLDSAYADAFAVGDLMLDGVGKEFCGRIVSVHKEAAKSENANGVFTCPHKQRLTVTVQGEAKEKNGVLQIGSITPAPGKTLFFHAPCHAEGLCLSVKILEQA